MYVQLIPCRTRDCLLPGLRKPFRAQPGRRLLHPLLDTMYTWLDVHDPRNSEPLMYTFVGIEKQEPKKDTLATIRITDLGCAVRIIRVHNRVDLFAMTFDRVDLGQQHLTDKQWKRLALFVRLAGKEIETRTSATSPTNALNDWLQAVQCKPVSQSDAMNPSLHPVTHRAWIRP